MSSDAVATPQGPPHIHHMDSTTAYHSAKLGMWLFLATEILLFGGLFAAFAIYRWLYLPNYHHGSAQLNWQLGALNTVVLLFSSYTAVLAVDAAQHGRNDKVRKNVIITLLCACGFLVIKFIEYRDKYLHGYFPFSETWNSEEFIHSYQSFYSLYFCMTGLHAIHVVLGMGILIWIYFLARKNRFSKDYYTPVEVGALYWHLVDLIWIYLFPLLYLVG